MSDGNGLAEALLGLDGFRVLEVIETVELVVVIETTAALVGRSSCGVRAEAQDRTDVEVRDLACFGRPVRLRWRKRRWRCTEPLCDARTWTEASSAVSSRQVLTRRAGVEACRQVGTNARPVASLARELGVCWWTVMDAVAEHGAPLVEDPTRVGPVRQLGVDETSFLAANPRHATIYATGLVDLEARIVIDMVQGNSAADLRRWTRQADEGWLAGIEVVATDLAESFRAGLSPHLDHARRVADPFHVVRVANRCLDKVRRRVQPRPSATGAARPILSTASASSSSPDPSASTSGATRACCSACASEIPPTKYSAPGWPRSRCATSTWPRTEPRRRCCSTRPSPAAPATTSRRFARSAGPSPRGEPRSWPTTTRGRATARPKG